MRYRAALCCVLLLLASPRANALFMSSGGAPPAQPSGPVIVSVTPTTASIPDTTAQNTTIITYVCTLSDGTTPQCRYALQTGSTLPSFLTLNGSQIQTNAAPVLTDCGPSQDSCTWSIVATAPSTTQSISGINLACSPTPCGFNVGSPAGTAIGTLSVTMSPGPAFAGSLALIAGGTGCSGTGDTTHFQITGTAAAGFTLATLGTGAPAGNYTICVQAAQTGMASVNQNFTITASSATQSLGATTLSCGPTCTFPANAAGVVGTLATATNPSSPGFSGSYNLVSSGGSCSAGDDTTHFSVAQSGGIWSLSTSGTPAAAYKVCVQTVQASATNSPQYTEFSLTGVTATKPALVATGATVANCNYPNNVTSCSFNITLVAGSLLVWGVDWCGTPPSGSTSQPCQTAAGTVFPAITAITASPSANLSNCSIATGFNGTMIISQSKQLATLYCQVTGTGATTVTVNWASQTLYPSIVGIAEFSGIRTNAPDEGIGTYLVGTPNHPYNGSISVTTPYAAQGVYDLVYSYAFGFGMTAGTGQTLLDYSTTADLIQYSLASTASPQTVTATGTAQIPGMSVVVFAAASSPPPTLSTGGPTAVSVSNGTPSGNIIAPLLVTTSNGAPFTGTITLSDPQGLTTLSQETGGGWMLRAAKQFTSANNGTDNVSLTASQTGSTLPWSLALTVAPTTIASINPGTINAWTDFKSGTPVAWYTCRTNDGTWCNATWTATGLPSYLTLLSNGQLRLNRDLTSADAPATPTWTVTPTMTAPTTSTQCPATAPDAAQAAGYNAQLLCWDFTAAIPNTVGTGLSGTGACQGGLDCYLGCADNAGGQASDNMAHALYADYGIKYCNPTYNYNSAPAVRQVTDGTRGLALQIAWTPAAQQTAGQQWSIHTVAMSYDTPARLPALYNDFPFAAYVEETLRTNVESSGPAVPSQPGISGVGGGFLWTVTGPTSDVYNNHGVLEQDILEIVSKYTGVKSQPDSNFNNNCDIAGCIYKLEPVPTEGFFTDYPALPGGTSFSFAVPHKFAYLKTTDGVNASVCFFIDGVLFPTVEYPNDSYYPCVHYPPVPLPQTPPGPFTHTLGAGTVAERETMNIWNGSFGLTGPNRCPDSTNTYNSDCLTMPSEGAIITWLEGIRVYTCGGAMGHAVGSGPNPWCLAGTPGQLYTGPQGAKIFRVTQQ